MTLLILNKTTNELKKNHEKTKTFTLSETTSFDINRAKFTLKANLRSRYGRLSEAVLQADTYEVFFINEFAPSDRRRRYEYIKELILPCNFVRYCHSTGNMNLNFLWKFPAETTDAEILNKSTEVRDNLLLTIPKYHTRAMRSEFITSFGRVTGTKSSILREAYRRLTGDDSASRTTDEEEIDKRVNDFLTLEDAELLYDLRVNNKGQPEKYEQFLKLCQTYINSTLDTATDERRHDSVTDDDDGTTVITHLATALSVRELHDGVKKMAPEDCPIPSIQWLRLQFWPRNKHAATSRYFTGKLKLKFMVQSRQFRSSHVDVHYASALFRYEKEFAIQFRDNTEFFCMDDKHTCKIGEPNHPVAAVERGKKVIVNLNKSFQVADHDFTKISITPSVTLRVNVPDSIDGSFYDGQVYVGIKENCFEASSPIRHMAELYNVIQREEIKKPILCFYTDGGPDHRVTYASVQIALICLFLKTDSDMIIAVRTPPQNSWKDPAERVMSILNIGLQSVGLMRNQLTNVALEHKLKKAKNMKEIRSMANITEGLKEQVVESVRPMKDLLLNIFTRLKLKENYFKTFDSASETDITELWNEILRIEPSLTPTDTTKEKISKKHNLLEFIKHHCVQRHYMFSIKKCERLECETCSFPQLPPSLFSNLHHLPDPVPNGEHYKSFDDLFGTSTTEQYRPSMKEVENKHHGMPFSPSTQFAKTTMITLSCGECNKPRVCYSRKKLKDSDKVKIMRWLEDVSYTCGTSFDDEDSCLNLLHMRKNLICTSLIEVPYYGALHKKICIYCGDSERLRDEKGCYPLCEGCLLLKRTYIKRRGASD